MNHLLPSPSPPPPPPPPPPPKKKTQQREGTAAYWQFIYSQATCIQIFHIQQMFFFLMKQLLQLNLRPVLSHLVITNGSISIVNTIHTECYGTAKRYLALNAHKKQVKKKHVHACIFFFKSTQKMWGRKLISMYGAVFCFTVCLTLNGVLDYNKGGILMLATF